MSRLLAHRFSSNDTPFRSCRSEKTNTISDRFNPYAVTVRAAPSGQVPGQSQSTPDGSTFSPPSKSMTACATSRRKARRAVHFLSA